MSWVGLVNHPTTVAWEGAGRDDARIRGEVTEMTLQSLSEARRVAEDARRGVWSRRVDMLLLTAIVGLTIFFAGLLSFVLPVQAGQDLGLSGAQALALVALMSASAVLGLCWVVHIRFRSIFLEYDGWASEIDAAFIIASTQSPPEENQQTSVLETLLRARGMFPRWLADQRSRNIHWSHPLWLAIFFLGPPGFILLVSGAALLISDPGMAVLMLATGCLLVGPIVFLHGQHRSRQRRQEIQLVADWDQRLGTLMEQIDHPNGNM